MKRLRVPVNIQDLFFRKYESNYLHLDYKHMRDEATDTGCIKPCKYKRYRLDCDQQPMSAAFKETIDGFGLWAISNYTMVGMFTFINLEYKMLIE